MVKNDCSNYDLNKINFKLTSPYIKKEDKLLFLKEFVNSDFKLVFDFKTGNTFIDLTEKKEDLETKFQGRIAHYLKTNIISLGNLSYENFNLTKKEAQFKLIDYVQQINYQFNVFVKSNELILNEITSKLEQGLLKYEELFKEPLKKSSLQEKREEILNLSHPNLYNVHKNWKIQDHTLGYVLQLEKNMSGINGFDVGLGKAQPLSSMILTPFGWKKMKDLKVGDEVFAYDGTITKILNIFPQGIKDVYEIQFNDGARAHSCKDHLWFTQTFSELEESKKLSKKDSGIKTLLSGSVKELKDLDLKDRHVIPTVCPINFIQKNPLPVNPYLLGLVIGNLIKSQQSYLTLNDFEREELHILEVLELDVENELKTCLDLLNQQEELSIPEEYLFASLKNRELLAQGLLDSNSYLKQERRSIVFNSPNEGLSFDIKELLLSLGASCHIYQYEDIYNKFNGNDYFHLMIKFPTQFKINPFRKNLKNKIWKEFGNVRALRTITNIEKIGEEECQCIMIDHPSHLYITDGYVVTHNTSTSLIAVQNLHNKNIKNKTLFVVPQSALSNFHKEALLGEPQSKKSSVYVNGDDCLFFLDRKNNNVDNLFVQAKSDKYKKVFITYEDFYRLKLKPETIENYINYLLVNDNINEDSKKYKLFIEKLKKFMKSGNGKTKEELYFEDFNFDSIVIDEIHVYKNSKEIFGNINAKYLSIPPSSSKGLDAQIKCWYIRQYNKKYSEKEDGVVGLTATPLTNSPLEYYALLSLVIGEETLNALTGLSGVVEFMQSTCEIETEEDYSVDGEERIFEIFKGIKNLSILRPILFKIITFLTHEDVKQKTVIPNKIDFLLKPVMDESQKNKILLYKKAYKLCRMALYASEEELDVILSSQDWKNYVIPVIKMFHEKVDIIGSPFNFISKMEKLLLDEDLDSQGLSFYIENNSKNLEKINQIISKFNDKKIKEKRIRPSKYTDLKDCKSIIVSEEEYFEVLVRAKILNNDSSFNISNNLEELKKIEDFSLSKGMENKIHIFIDSLDYENQLIFFNLLIKEFSLNEIELSCSPKMKLFVDKAIEENKHPRGKIKKENNETEYLPYVKQIFFCDLIGVHLKLQILLSKYLNIPMEEIVVLTGQTNNDTESVLEIQNGFNSVENNKYKIIIANEKAEVSINLQNGTQAIHHLTYGWTPDAKHQRDGRAVRQFNFTENVNVYSSIMKNSFDVYKNKLVSNKENWINKILDKNGDDYVPISNFTKKQYEEMIESLGEEDLENLTLKIEEEQRQKEIKTIINKQKNYLNFMVSDSFKILNKEEKNEDKKENEDNLVSHYLLSKMEREEKFVDELSKEEKQKIKLISEMFEQYYQYQQDLIRLEEKQKNQKSINNTSIDNNLLDKLQSTLILKEKLITIINQYRNEMEDHFYIDDNIYLLFKPTAYSQKKFEEENVLLKQRSKIDLFIELILKHGKNFNPHREIAVNYLNYFDLKPLLKNKIILLNNIFDLLYKKTKEEYIYQHSLNPINSLPLSLLKYADKGELYKFENEYFYKGCIINVNKNINQSLYSNEINLKALPISSYIKNKIDRQEEVSEQEMAYFNYKEKNIKIFNSLPNFLKPDEYFLKAIKAFYQNILNKRENGLLEKDFRILFTEDFCQILNKIQFNLFEIVNEHQSRNITTIFNIQDDQYRFISVNRIRDHHLKNIKEEFKKDLNLTFKVYYEEEIEIFELFNELINLYNAYIACYRLGGVSKSRMDDLVKDIISQPQHLQALCFKNDFKYITQLNLNFLKTLLSEINKNELFKEENFVIMLTSKNLKSYDVYLNYDLRSLTNKPLSFVNIKKTNSDFDSKILKILEKKELQYKYDQHWVLHLETAKVLFDKLSEKDKNEIKFISLKTLSEVKF